MSKSLSQQAESRFSARSRLFLLVLVVIFPAFLLQVSGAWSDLRRDVNARQQEAVNRLEVSHRRFIALVEDTQRVFEDLVRLPEMRDPENCILIFSNLRSAYDRLAPDVVNVGLADDEGNIYCAVNPVQGARNIAEQMHFLRAARSLSLSLGDYHRDPATSAPSLDLAYPVLSFDSKLQTVIFVNIQAHWLAGWLNEAAIPAGATITLIAPNGELILQYPDSDSSPETLTAGDAAWFAPLQNGQTVVEAPDLDGVVRLHTLMTLRYHNQTPGMLHLGYPVAEIYDQANQSLRWQLAWLATITVFALVIAWWGSEILFLRPLHNLMRVVGQVQHGDLGARAADVRALAELTELGQSFDRMAESLQQREQARQQAQVELQSSEARFRAMFENSAVGIGVITLDHKIITANPALCAMLGRSLEELVGGSPNFVTHTDDIQNALQMHQQLVSGERDSYVSERRYLRKDGSSFWASVSMSIVRDHNRSPLYLIGLILDVDERRKMEEKLAEQESQYLARLEHDVQARTHELADANARLVDEIKQRKRAEEALAMKAAEDAVAVERTRLARDLHDAVTQTLFSASLVAEVLPELWRMDPEVGRSSTEELRQLTRGALAEMRTLLLELRPAALTQARFPDLLRQLTEALTNRARLPIALHLEGERPLPPEVQVALYRIAQESLNNVFKYARASQVDVNLSLSPTGAYLEICDNGVGFDLATLKPTSLGMKIMSERADSIGADFHVESQPGQGTCVSATWMENQPAGVLSTQQ
jgi:PAS domain S-box-containing protein